MITFLPLVWTFLCTVGHLSSIKGVKGQESQHSIRLPWESTNTEPLFHNPLGDTIAVVDSSMVRAIPEKETDATRFNIDEQNTTDAEARVNTSKMTKNEDVSRAKTVIKEQNINKDVNETIHLKTPLVTAANIDGISENILQNQHLQSNTVPNEHRHFQQMAVGSIKPDLTERLPHFQTKPNILSPRNIPINTFLSSDIPFHYKTNFSHSHSSGKSENFSVTWNNDNIHLHAVNETFKRGNQAHHQTVQLNSSKVHISNKSEHSFNTTADARLAKDSKTIQIAKTSRSAQFGTNESSGNVKSKDFNSLVRKNKTNHAASTNSFEFGKDGNPNMKPSLSTLVASSSGTINADVEAKLNSQFSKMNSFLNNNIGLGQRMSSDISAKNMLNLPDNGGIPRRIVHDQNKQLLNDNGSQIKSFFSTHTNTLPITTHNFKTWHSSWHMTS